MEMKKFLLRRVPLCGWITRYSKEDALGDLIAGVTISLTMIPQSIAYSALAGLDPQYGLNSAFVGCFIYVFFGTIKEVVIGPSSLLSLLTYEYTRHLNVDFVVLLTFLSGLVELLMGVLQLGFLVSFISTPVVSGFTSASSIIIVVSQIGDLLGIETKAAGFMGKLWKITRNVKYFRWGDTILGLSCIAGCLFLRKLKDVQIDPTCSGRGVLTKLFWFLSIGRNFLAVFLASCLSMVYKHHYSYTPFITAKAVESGLPSFHLPPVSTQIGNRTYIFPEMVAELGAGYFVIPVVSVLANVAIAKAFVKGSVDATQEMMSLSMCNMVGSCFQSMPTNGAFTRSAVISASGVRTPLAGLYSAFLTMTALQFLGPYFHYIPRSSLSAILIAAVVFLVDWEIIKPLWRCKKFDLVTLVATLILCLCFGVEIGLLFGVVFALADLVYKWYSLQVTVTQKTDSNGNYTILQPSLPLYFPSVDYVTSLIAKTTEDQVEKSIPIVIDCRGVSNSDYSVAKAFASLACAFEKRGQLLVFMNVPDKTRKIWETAGCNDAMFCSSIDVEQKLMGQNRCRLNAKEKSAEEYELDEERESMIPQK